MFTISSKSCNDIHNCRTGQSIIFNCASTTFLCTWVALHLDVPENPLESRFKSFLRRVGWMMVALLAPEAVLLIASADWTASSKSLTDKLSEHGMTIEQNLGLQCPLCFPGHDPNCDLTRSLTETHAMLARMRGLRIVGEDDSEELCEDIYNLPNDVKMPTLREIQDRGKGDYVAKAITIIQTLWFAIQTAHRVYWGLIVTELELTTLGHVVLNVFIAWCWWNKPLNLQFPIEVHRRGQYAFGTYSTVPWRKLPFRVRFGTYAYQQTNVPWGQKAAVMLICCSVIGGLFGAIHCLAWNSIFPTPIEHLLWRVSASVVTLLPGLGFAIYVFAHAEARGVGEFLLKTVVWLLAAAYCLSRICLLALAVGALRALPERAYESPSWTVYVPHIG